MLIEWRIVGLLLGLRLVGCMRFKGGEGRGLRCGIKGLQVRIGSWGCVGRGSGRGGDRIGILLIGRVSRRIAGVIGGSVTVGKRRR